MIKGNCHIKALLLAQNFLTSKAAGSLASLIKQEEAEFNSIMTLDLSNNGQVSDEGVEMIAGALTVRFEQLFFPNSLHQVPIYSLKLNFIGMKDRGLLALNKVVSRAQQIMQDEEIDSRMTLEISGNLFGSQSFQTFAESLAQFRGISKLNISECSGLQDLDVVRLVDALGSNFSITDLDLTGIKITRSGYQELFTLFNQNCSIRNVRVLIDDEFKIAVVEKGTIMKHFSILGE
jgi:Ran GTPase-activating protein (RanGAP) involved in mRNA processing and transport